MLGKINRQAIWKRMLRRGCWNIPNQRKFSGKCSNEKKYKYRLSSLGFVNNSSNSICAEYIRFKNFSGLLKFSLKSRASQSYFDITKFLLNFLPHPDLWINVSGNFKEIWRRKKETKQLVIKKQLKSYKKFMKNKINMIEIKKKDDYLKIIKYLVNKIQWKLLFVQLSKMRKKILTLFLNF